MTVRRSTAFDFMVVVVTALVIGQGALGMWFLLNEKITYRKTREVKASMEARFLAEYSTEFLQSGERAKMDSFIDTLRADTEILSIRIRRSDGMMVLKEDFGEPAETGMYNPFYVPPQNTVRAPIRAGGAVIGEVELHYSGAAINEEMRRLLTTFPAFQALIFMCAALVIYVLFRVKISRPLKELGQDVGRVNAGDLSVTVKQDYAREIATVAKGVQALVDRLSYTISRLDVASEKVARTSKRVIASTRALADSSRRQGESTESMAVMLKGAGDTHKQLIGITEDLSSLSSENVSSLLEVKAMGDEIV